MNDERILALMSVANVAQELWDNRLGHRPGNPVWSSPKEFWKDLGQALTDFNKTEN